MDLSNEFMAKPREASRPAKLPYGPSIKDSVNVSDFYEFSSKQLLLLFVLGPVR